MKYLVPLLTPFFIYWQPDNQGAPASHQEASFERLKAGFYLAIPDTSRLGYKMHNKDDYYFLRATPAVTLKEVDSIYIEFNKVMKRYTLICKFNVDGTKKWVDFANQNNGRKVALVLKDEIYHVGTLAAPFDSSELVLTNAETKKELESLRALCETATRKAK